MTHSAQPTRSPLDSSGLIIVDKPQGLSSHDVVARCRRIMKTKKVGHSGTLDPMATGVLVLGIERGTKFLAHVVTHDKRYEATVRLGASTVTDDAEGEVTSQASPTELTAVSAEAIREAFAAQTGEIMQRPTSVSSIKIDGRRAHELVREGHQVEIPARPVTVFSLNAGDPVVVFGGDGTPAAIDIPISVHCSSGTYIRAIARDVGAALGVGGHLTALRRTSVGPFHIAQARTLEQLSDAPRLALTLDEAMVTCFPTREITEDQGEMLSLGKWLEPVGLTGLHAAVTPSGKAIALLREKGKRAASEFVARPHGL